MKIAVAALALVLIALAATDLVTADAALRVGAVAAVAAGALSARRRLAARAVEPGLEDEWHARATGRSRPPASPRPRVEALESLIDSGTRNAGDAHHRLRPVLRPLAVRAAAQAGFDLDRDTHRGVEAFGAAGYDLVRADRSAPADPFGPGVAPADLAHLVARLEQVSQ